jgi:hypothetical protein
MFPSSLAAQAPRSDTWLGSSGCPCQAKTPSSLTPGPIPRLKRRCPPVAPVSPSPPCFSSAADRLKTPLCAPPSLRFPPSIVLLRYPVPRLAVWKACPPPSTVNRPSSILRSAVRRPRSVFVPDSLTVCSPPRLKSLPCHRPPSAPRSAVRRLPSTPRSAWHLPPATCHPFPRKRS